MCPTQAKSRFEWATPPGSAVITYIYGADGKRVEKETPSGNIYYDYDYDGSLDATYTLSGTTLTVTTQDLFLNGEHLGFFFGNSNIYRSALDWVGSVRTRVDPSANIISADRNFPFGEMQTEYLPSLPTWGDADDTIHFTGKERDTESGLDYFGARYYSSNMGRFLSPDEPFYSGNLDNPQDLNLYSYVHNNPLTNVDPDGHDVHVCVDGGQCFDATDDQWKQIQQNSPGVQFNLNNFGSGTISCGGSTCGSAQYFEPGLKDDASTFLNIASMVDGVRGGIAGVRAGVGFGRALLGVIGGEAAGAEGATFQSIWDAATSEAGTGTARVATRVKDGGFAQAQKDFDALGGTAVKAGPTQVKELPNGEGRAVLRDFSSPATGNRPTIELQPSGGGAKGGQAIRYNP